MNNSYAGLNYFASSLKMIKAKSSRFSNVLAVHSSRDVVKNVACVFCADLQAQLRDLCVFCPSPTFKYIIHRCFPSSSFLFIAASYVPFARIIIIFIFFTHGCDGASYRESTNLLLDGPRREPAPEVPTFSEDPNAPSSPSTSILHIF